jgi:hypothetical protein
VVLLQAQRREEEIEHLRFLISIRASNLSPDDSSGRDELKKLLDYYYDLINPNREKLTDKTTVEKRQKLLDDFSLKLKSGKLKNFQRTNNNA